MREFGALEAEIMDVLWLAPTGLTIREILDHLSDRGSAYTTVMTVTERLRVKGWLSRAASGRAFRYMPVHTKEYYIAASGAGPRHLQRPDSRARPLRGKT